MKLRVEVGSLNPGDRFWFRNAQFEVVQNNGSRYVVAVSLQINANLHLDQQEEVEVERDAD